MIIGHVREGGAILTEIVPAPAPPAYHPLGVGILVRGIAVPAVGLGVIVPCLGSRALAPRTVRSHVDESALTVTLHDRLLPVCGLVAPGRGLLTATRIDECARALGVTARGLDDCARD